MPAPLPPAAPYLWNVGEGPDPQALRRLRDGTPLPVAPMGEAWFMGEERGMFPGLMHDDPQQWPDREVEQALFELSSGPNSFGHLPEWTEWCGFLLARAQSLIGDERLLSSGQYLHGALASALFVHYPDPQSPTLSPRMRRDLLDTLGRTVLAPQHWRDGRIAPSWFFAPLSDYTIHGLWLSGGGAFAASSMLVLKYLDPELIDGWLDSVLAIDDPAWRAGWAIWLAGSAPLILDGMQPSEFKEDDKHPVAWWNHHVVRGIAPDPDPDANAPLHPFIDPLRRDAFVASLRRRVGRAQLIQWGRALRAPEGHRLSIEGARRQYDQAVDVIVKRYGLGPAAPHATGLIL